MSRMWGTTLDHVEEVEVVTANGTVTRASNHQNPDLFFVRSPSRKFRDHDADPTFRLREVRALALASSPSS